MQFIEVVPFEQAEKEVNGWLESRKIRPSKRADLQKNIDDIIEGVQYGLLAINDDATITQKLLFPYEIGVGSLEKVVYKSRLSDEILKSRLKTVKLSDNIGVMNAYLSALTGQSEAIMSKMESEDKGLAIAILGFFIYR